MSTKQSTLRAARIQLVASTYRTRARNPAQRTQQHAPSAVSNACATVRALAIQHNYDRAATLAACKAAGINPATAATQFANAKRAHVAAGTAPQTDTE